MKIKMQFGPAKTAIIAVVAVVSLALIILDALLLGGVFGEAVNVPVASVSLVAGVIIFVASLSLVLGSHYTLGDTEFKGVFGFFYTMEIPYALVISVRQNSQNNQVIVNVENQKGGMTSVTLYLKGETANHVAKEIATKSGMLVDYFAPEDKK